MLEEMQEWSQGERSIELTTEEVHKFNDWLKTLMFSPRNVGAFLDERDYQTQVETFDKWFWNVLGTIES